MRNNSKLFKCISIIALVAEIIILNDRLNSRIEDLAFEILSEETNEKS